MTIRERYEAARHEEREAHRRLCVADGNGASPQELARLSHEHEDAQKERRRAFHAYMESTEP